MAFGLSLVCFLALPLLLRELGLPSREQAFSMVPVGAGRVSEMKSAIYDHTANADVVILGSSVIQTDVHPEKLSEDLSRELGHPVRALDLGMSWYGADMQYFLLHDYLAHHSAPKLVVLHVPQAHATTNEPHPQAYRWLRYGDVPGFPRAFPPFANVQMYAEMVLGAPRQLLSLVRPNVVAPDDQPSPAQAAPPPGSVSDSDTTDIGPLPVPAASLEPTDSPLFVQVKPSLMGDNRFRLGDYTLYFLKQIAALVRKSGSSLVLIHAPLGDGKEPSTGRVAEITDWSKVFGRDVKMIAIPMETLYRGTDPAPFYGTHDIHMSWRGGARFTESVAGAVAKAFNEAESQART
jgi:hypothetical protein